MSEYIQKPGTISVFANKKKENEKQPDYTGTIVLDKDYKQGDVIRLGLWKRTSKKDPSVVFLGGNISEPKSEKQDEPQHIPDSETDLPF